jgi:hypothetical protein
LIEFCLRCQLERNPVTADDIFELMREAGKQVDRFWVCRFIGRNKYKLAVHEAVLLEKERHKVSAGNLERYFETVGMYLKDVPSFFVWKADGTRIGSPKK